MPSSLPKYSGLITEHQLSILDEFISVHDGISKARVLGRLLEAWQDAGKPILGDRDTTLHDLALQFEQLDLDALVAQKVREYLDIHLDFLVNNLVENKLRPISNINNKKTALDDNLVKNGLLTNGLEDDESLAEGNIVDKGESKVDNLNKKDINKDIQKVNNLDFEEISSTEEGHNLVKNKVSNKVIENDEGKREVKDSFISTIREENPASQLVITLDENKVNNQPDVSHIPADFLALPQGKVETKKLAQTFGLSSSARVTDLASGKNKTLPFPEFEDYLSVETTSKTQKNGKKVINYEENKKFRLKLNQGRGYHFISGGELPMDYEKD